MAIHIDDGTVQRLIQTALLAVTGIESIVIGEEIPEDTDVIAILVGLTLERLPRVSANDAALANLSLEVQVVVGPDQASSCSIGELVAKVCKALSEPTALVDVTTTHAVELNAPTTQIGVDIGDVRSNRGGRVTCTGTVRRDSGETIAAFIT